MFLISPLICTLVLLGIAYWLLRPLHDHLFRLSLLSTLSGILQFLILRGLMGSIEGLRGAGATSDILIQTALGILTFSLIVAIILMIMQHRIKPKRIYTTTLGTQILLLIITCYFASYLFGNLI